MVNSPVLYLQILWDTACLAIVGLSPTVSHYLHGIDVWFGFALHDLKYQSTAKSNRVSLQDPATLTVLTPM